MYCSNCGTYIPDDGKFCPVCGQQVMNMAKPVQEMPMKWHKFLCYFGLWIGVLMNASSAIRGFMGSDYEPIYYQWIPGLRAMTIFTGFVGVAFAVCGVYIALGLIGYKKDAPKNLLRMYMLAMGVNAIQYFGLIGLLLHAGANHADLASLYGTAFGSILANVAMMGINKTYYSKRMHMFVN